MVETPMEKFDKLAVLHAEKVFLENVVKRQAVVPDYMQLIIGWKTYNEHDAEQDSGVICVGKPDTGDCVNYPESVYGGDEKLAERLYVYIFEAMLQRLEAIEVAALALIGVAPAESKPKKLGKKDAPKKG